MSKKLSALILVLCLILVGIAPVYAVSTGDLPEYALEEDVKIALNGDVLKIPKEMGKPHVDSRNERTMVPMRFMAEVMGWFVEYLPEDGGVVKIDNRVVFLKFKIGSRNIEKTQNGKTETITLDAETYAYGDRTYVPLRFIVESMGPGVEWIQDSFTVNIYTSRNKAILEENRKSDLKTEETKTEEVKSEKK